MLNCAACHGTKLIEIPGVTRWTEVFACKDCGTLKVRVKDVGDRADTKVKKGEGGDS